MKNMMTKFALLFSALIIAGCSGPHLNSGADGQKRNEVKLVKVPYNVTFPANKSRMSTRELVKLDQFLAQMNVTYGDEFSLDLPFDEKGNVSKLNKARMAFVSEILKRRGIHLGADLTPYGTEPKKDQAKLILSRYVVTPPQCGDWSQKASPNYSNVPLKDFGCSTQAQLGLMVANPRDLLGGNTSNGSDSERAAFAIERYRTNVRTISNESTGGGSGGSGGGN